MLVRTRILGVGAAVVDDEAEVPRRVAPGGVDGDVPVSAVAIDTGRLQLRRAPCRLVLRRRAPGPQGPAGEGAVRPEVVDADRPGRNGRVAGRQRRQSE